MRARIVSSVLLTFVMIAVGTAQIIAVGTLGVTVLGLDYTTSVIVLGIGFIVYTLAGGMIAVGCQKIRIYNSVCCSPIWNIDGGVRNGCKG